MLQRKIKTNHTKIEAGQMIPLRDKLNFVSTIVNFLILYILMESEEAFGTKANATLNRSIEQCKQFENETFKFDIQEKNLNKDSFVLSTMNISGNNLQIDQHINTFLSSSRHQQTAGKNINENLIELNNYNDPLYNLLKKKNLSKNQNFSLFIIQSDQKPASYSGHNDSLNKSIYPNLKRNELIRRNTSEKTFKPYRAFLSKQANTNEEISFQPNSPKILKIKLKEVKIIKNNTNSINGADQSLIDFTINDKRNDKSYNWINLLEQRDLLNNRLRRKFSQSEILNILMKIASRKQLNNARRKKLAEVNCHSKKLSNILWSNIEKNNSEETSKNVKKRHIPVSVPVRETCVHNESSNQTNFYDKFGSKIPFEVNRTDPNLSDREMFKTKLPFVKEALLNTSLTGGYMYRNHSSFNRKDEYNNTLLNNQDILYDYLEYAASYDLDYNSTFGSCNNHHNNNSNTAMRVTFAITRQNNLNNVIIINVFSTTSTTTVCPAVTATCAQKTTKQAYRMIIREKRFNYNIISGSIIGAVIFIIVSVACLFGYIIIIPRK